jgi:hypothetical protein
MDPGSGRQEVHHFLSAFIGVHRLLNSYFRDGVTDFQTSSPPANSRIQKRMTPMKADK